jgi:hypothetical protein
MPSLCQRDRHNADLKAKYDQLVAAGKRKVAITAVMRKPCPRECSFADHRKWAKSGGQTDTPRAAGGLHLTFILSFDVLVRTTSDHRVDAF